MYRLRTFPLSFARFHSILISHMIFNYELLLIIISRWIDTLRQKWCDQYVRWAEIIYLPNDNIADGNKMRFQTHHTVILRWNLHAMEVLLTCSIHKIGLKLCNDSFVLNNLEMLFI